MHLEFIGVILLGCRNAKIELLRVLNVLSGWLGSKRNDRRIKATSHLCICHLEVLTKSMQARHLGDSMFQGETLCRILLTWE